MAEHGRDGRFRRKGAEGTTGKLTPERTAAIIAGLEMGLSRTDAAQAVGVDRRTVNRWATEDPAFADALDQAESRAKRLLTSMVMQAAAQRLPNTWQAAAWLLERRWPDQFGQKSRLDVSLDIKDEVRRLSTLYNIPESDLVATAEAIVIEHAQGKVERS